MRALLQRTGNAKVVVADKTVGKIDQGLVVLVGFTEGDTLEKIEYMAKKIVNLRIFPDENDVMNKSILDYGGKILSISQFTLYSILYFLVADWFSNPTPHAISKLPSSFFNP